MAQDFKRGVSPKAQKRMAEFKHRQKRECGVCPVSHYEPDCPLHGEMSRPPRVLDGELDEAAFGKLVKRKNPKVEDEK